MGGLYVHIPFCVRKCSYCDFFSVAAGGPAMDAFCRLLAREAEIFRDVFPEDARAPHDTVFLGGGTPTVLGSARLSGLLAALRERLPVAAGAEISVEANPGTLGADDLRRLREAGFNRLSLGAQSFDAGALRVLGRIHGGDDVRRAVRDAREAGFPSVGMDLIFGIPGQSAAAWKATLEEAVSLLPDHVSAYALSPEPGTPLHAAVERGELEMPSGDEAADMYDEACRVLAGAGFLRYEISNFAKAGHECRHNIKYWRRERYAGLGPSAASLLFPPGRAPLGLRTTNAASLARYGEMIGSGRPALHEARVLTEEDAWKESLIAGLRQTSGIDLAEVETRNGPPPEPLRRAVEELVKAGRLVLEGTRLRLPGHLMFVSNEVLLRLA